MIEIWVAIITAVISPSLLFLYQMVREKRRGFNKKIDEILLRQLRFELLFALEHNPDDDNTILTLFDRYRSAGGNSYVCEYVQRWKKNRRQPRAKLTKGKKNAKII